MNPNFDDLITAIITESFNNVGTLIECISIGKTSKNDEFALHIFTGYNAQQGTNYKDNNQTVKKLFKELKDNSTLEDIAEISLNFMLDYYEIIDVNKNSIKYFYKTNVKVEDIRQNKQVSFYTNYDSIYRILNSNIKTIFKNVETFNLHKKQIVSKQNYIYVKGYTND